MNKVTLIDKYSTSIEFEYNEISDLKKELKSREIVVNKNVKIGKGVSIGSKTSIGSNAVIGDNVVLAKSVTIGNHTNIMNNVSVETRTVIEDKCVIHDNCIIKDRAIIGQNTVIKKGIVIGSQNEVDPNTILDIAFYRESEYEDMVYVGNNKLSVGCETFDIKQWKEIAYSLGEEKGVSKEAVTKYLEDAQEIELILKNKKND